jgi:hypothetical protein
VLSHVSFILNSAGKNTAPIAGLKYQCDKKDKEAMHVLVDPSNKRKSADLQLLENYTSSSKCDLTPQQKKKQRTVSPVNINDDKSAPPLPVPANGTQYTKHEVIEILKDHPQTGSSEKAAMIASMVEKNLVPCNSATIYRLMQNHHKGKVCPNPDWVKGRPPLLSHQAKSELKECMMKDVGRSFGKDDINDTIVNKRNEMIKEAGRDTLS